MKEKILGKGITRRRFSVVLALAMVLSLMPNMGITAQAASTTQTVGDYEIIVPENVTLTGVSASTTVSQVQTEDLAEFGEGWYVVSESVSIPEFLGINGDVNLILADGASLTTSTIFSMGNLTIWGQENGTGKLIIDGEEPLGIDVENELTINGGDVQVNSIYGGIKSSSQSAKLTVNGGALRVFTDNLGEAGIDKLKVSITGGTVNVTGQKGISSNYISVTGGDVTVKGSRWAISMPQDTGELIIGNGLEVKVADNMDGTGNLQSVTAPWKDNLSSDEGGSPKYVHIHRHKFTYAASGAILTATCGNTGCDLNGNKVTLALTAEDANYSGNAYDGASLGDKSAWTTAGLTVPAIKYVGRGTTTYAESEIAPVESGMYTAKITMGDDKTASKDFEITAAEYDINVTAGSNGTARATVSGSEVTKASKGAEVTLTATPTPSTGYVFDQWTGVSGITINVTENPISFTMPEGAVNATATFKLAPPNTYTVSFDSNGGSAVASQTIVKNASAHQPTAPTKSGYTFVKWQLDGVDYMFDEPVTANITLKAVWQKNAADEYNIIVNIEGHGTASATPSNAKAGDEITLTATADTGYKFDKWVSDDVTVNNNKFTMPSKDVTVTAVFVSNGNSGKIEDETKPEDNDHNAKINSSTLENILTDDDIEAIKNGETVKVFLEESKQSESAVPTDVKKAIEKELPKDYKVGAYLNIDLFKKVGDREKEQISNLNGKEIDIIIKVPESIRNRDYKYTVIRVHDDKAKEITAPKKAGKDWDLTISSGLFSTYAVAYSEDKGSDEDSHSSSSDDKKYEAYVDLDTNKSEVKYGTVFMHNKDDVKNFTDMKVFTPDARTKLNQQLLAMMYAQNAKKNARILDTKSIHPRNKLLATELGTKKFLTWVNLEKKAQPVYAVCYNNVNKAYYLTGTLNANGVAVFPDFIANDATNITIFTLE